MEKNICFVYLSKIFYQYFLCHLRLLEQRVSSTCDKQKSSKVVDGAQVKWCNSFTDGLQAAAKNNR